VNEEFAEKLQEAGVDQNKLVGLMNEIDETKRSVKSHLSQLSSERNEENATRPERQKKIRKMKDKMSFLTEEREVVRSKLGTIKADQKALNKSSNSKNIEFAHAFMAAAERLLTEEIFNEIESRARDIIESKKGR
jgi:seryl-tRNA synthetase